MKKIAILNFKGGTGKITTAVNLSHASALKGQNNWIFARNSWKKPALGAGCKIPKPSPHNTSANSSS